MKCLGSTEKEPVFIVSGHGLRPRRGVVQCPLATQSLEFQALESLTHSN